MMSIVDGDIYSSNFDTRHTCYITGASADQLYRWKKEGIISAEYAPDPWCYSYRDLVEIRLAAFLRAQHPMRVVREALAAVDRKVMNPAPDEYLVPVAGSMMPLKKAFRPYTNLAGRKVRDFEQPFPHIMLHPGHFGGWFCYNRSRINFESLIVGTREDIETSWYMDNIPPVPKEAVYEAFDLHDELQTFDQPMAAEEKRAA